MIFEEKSVYLFVEKKTVTTINQEKVSKITFKNDNNYSASFFNFGGYSQDFLQSYMLAASLPKDEKTIVIVASSCPLS